MAKVDLSKIESAVSDILVAVGEDPQREGLRETPARVARMYQEMFSGLHDNPRRHLKQFFEQKYDEIVMLRDIAFHSMCEHHLLPFFGHAHIAYLPKGKVLGLSKLARTVDSFAKRPQIQEQLTDQIADALTEHTGAKGVAVVIEATHTCMTIRGVQKPGAVMVTSALRGHFRQDPASRAEVMSLLHGNSR